MSAVLTYTGPFLVYFNRHLDFPRVWCIANPRTGWEVNVTALHLDVQLFSRYEKREVKADHSGPPAAWFEGVGTVTVDANGIARIYPV